jgi:hypothetical protein
MGQQPDFVAHRRKLVVRGQRDEDFVAHPLNLHDDLGGERLNQFAMQKSDHTLLGIAAPVPANQIFFGAWRL